MHLSNLCRSDRCGIDNSRTLGYLEVWDILFTKGNYFGKLLFSFQNQLAEKVENTLLHSRKSNYQFMYRL